MPPSSRPTRRGAKEATPVTEKSEIRPTSSERPKVYYEKSLTKNLGDYNSVKITVGVSLPVDPTPEEIRSVDATIVVANTILDTEIEKQVTSILKED